MLGARIVIGCYRDGLVVCGVASGASWQVGRQNRAVNLFENDLDIIDLVDIITSMLALIVSRRARTTQTPVWFFALGQ